MPTSGASSGNDKAGGAGGRTTFRPPWVKGDPATKAAQPPPAKAAQPTAAAKAVQPTAAAKAAQPTAAKAVQPPPPAAQPPPATAPWARRNTLTDTQENGQPAAAQKDVKLQSREIKVPVMTDTPKKIQVPLKKVEPKDKELKREPSTKFIKDMPKLRHVDREDTINKSFDTESTIVRPVLKKVPKVVESSKPPPEIPWKDPNLNAIPPPPPMPSMPMPPPPPPPPALKPPEDFEKKPLSTRQKDVIEKLKLRPRRRPDWSEMMKEVEDGKKLRHVKCNDRSQPIITTKSVTKISGQFVYETEKANIHNQLLQQIQGGIRLKAVKTNDRSKPILEGLRKFRRQMTIEEQLQKSESRAQVMSEKAEPPVEESEDEMDDIDKLRDDLQSTKQMLALELRNREAHERENKLLTARVANLEAELAREKWTPLAAEPTRPEGPGEALVNSYKKDADEARKTCKDLEKKYQDTAEQLDSAKTQLERQKQQIAALEKRLAGGQGGMMGNYRRASEAIQKDSSPEPELEESESEEEEDEEKKAARLARRLGREVKMLRLKLTKFKDKQIAAKKERVSLREAMKKNQLSLKEENKKFKKLQKEVDKMAALMKDDPEDDEEKEEGDEEEEVEEEEEESETEEDTETEESGEESETETESESEEEDATDKAKKENLEPRVKRHESRLAALKKGNYLLQANVDGLLDEINKVREKSVTLQADLDSVLSELG